MAKNALELLESFRNDIRSHMDELFGVSVAVSAIDSKELVDANVINDELRRSGFTNELMIDMIPPSAIFHDYIKSLGTDRNAFTGTTNTKNQVYAYKRLVRDLTDKDNLRNGEGRIVYSVIKITAAEGRRSVVSEDTGEVARIIYTCRRRGKGFEEDPKVIVEIGELGNDSDADYFSESPKEFQYRLQQNYSVATVVAKINEIIQKQFQGIPLRPRGGIYFISKSKAEAVCDYLMAMAVCSPQHIRPILIGNSNNFGSASREMIATTVVDELMKDFNVNIDKWTEQVELLKNGDRRNFGKDSIANAIIEARVMVDRVKELETNLQFDFSRVKLMNDDLLDLLKSAMKVSN